MKKRKFVLTVAIVAGVSLGYAETRTASAKNVVEQFVKIDVKGARLTSQGWNQADELFTKHTEPSQPTFLVVIARRYAVSQDTTKKNYFVLGYDDIGHIDISTLRFTPTHVSMVRWFYSGYAVTRGHDGNASSEWKIEGAQPKEMHVTVDAATRWVLQARDKASDPASRRNADQTIIKLKPYH
jgi:hypothetical protein